ncbi:MAG: transglutaminase family protein [Bacteroidota bacterium]
MKFEVSAKLKYEVLASSTLILNVEALMAGSQFVLEESFEADQDLKMYNWNAVAGEKRFKVIELPANGEVNLSYRAVVENTCRVVPAKQLDETMISLMPVSVLPYLNPSRYCPSDKLYQFAADKFGKINIPYEQVLAVRDWIYKHVEYRAGHSTANTSAADTLNDKKGVCRDFAHLGIALCRALTIPARYFTGYAYKLKPQDFHACFEVYLGGCWIIVDATKLVPVNGLVKIATGMDASDSALASIFGNLKYLAMEVNTTALDEKFEDVDIVNSQGYSYQ